jgi:hypothetical protein
MRPYWWLLLEVMTWERLLVEVITWGRLLMAGMRRFLVPGLPVGVPVWTISCLGRGLGSSRF